MSAPIDEVDAPRIRVGLPARITLDAWRDREFVSRVQRIGDYIIDVEKQARTVEVELRFENPLDLADLRVGYSADVDIIIESQAGALRIPSETLLDANHVLRFDPSDQRLHRQEIEKGLGNWTYTEVLSGLSPGDLVVTTLGAEGVEDGVLATISMQTP
jgi:HlyD family secretion protein